MQCDDIIGYWLLLATPYLDTWPLFTPVALVFLCCSVVVNMFTNKLELSSRVAGLYYVHFRHVNLLHNCHVNAYTHSIE